MLGVVIYTSVWSSLLQYSYPFLGVVFPSSAWPSLLWDSHPLLCPFICPSGWPVFPLGSPGVSRGRNPRRCHRLAQISQAEISFTELKDTAEVYRKEFTLSFPDCLCISPLISSPSRTECCFSASLHPTTLASGDHASMTFSLPSRAVPSKPVVKNLQRYC